MSERRQHLRPVAWIALFALAMTAAAATSCASSSSDDSGSSETMSSSAPTGPIELDGVEITEYEGENLSSVNDFRENSIEGPQYVDVADYTLAVSGLVDDPKEYTYEEVLDEFQSYEKLVTLDCVEGWSVTVMVEGVLVSDIIEAADAEGGANTVIMHAVDGYTSSLPLDFYEGREIILAHSINGVTLPPERGFPFWLIAEQKWGYKWVKWVEEIELSDDEDYKGFWESRGYSNSADRDEPFFNR
jgi:DMSO/TMAO reductase YedYZ molybdopterin-dependent catalytic subunit